MKARPWLQFFQRALVERDQSLEEDLRDVRSLIDAVMERTGRDLGCFASVHRDDGSTSASSLGVDYAFFEHRDYGLEGVRHPRWEDRDPHVIPEVAVVHETSIGLNGIRRGIWRLCCLRAPLLVFIAYNGGKERQLNLLRELDSLVWEGGLARHLSGELILLIGEGNPDYGDLYLDAGYGAFEWKDQEFRPVPLDLPLP